LNHLAADDVVIEIEIDSVCGFFARRVERQSRMKSSLLAV
jgi:hypothetical protein